MSSELNALRERLTEASGVALRDEDVAELLALRREPKYASSDRARDRARTRLKKAGFIRFDRATWQWVIYPAILHVLIQGSAR